MSGRRGEGHRRESILGRGVKRVNQKAVKVGGEVEPVAAREEKSACGCCAPVSVEGRKPVQGTTTLTAPDITCGGCASAIKNALGGLEGVSRVEVDVAAKAVAVMHDGRVSREALTAALEKAGFPAF